MISGFYTRDPTPFPGGCSCGDLTRPSRSATNLSVSNLKMNFGVTGLAERHEVAPTMISALRNGEDMVYLLHGSQPSFLKALLTQGMRRSVTVADSFPASAVLLVRVGTACVFVILLRGKSLMLLTVLTALDSQHWAASVSAPAPWSPRHTNHLTFRA